LWEVHHNIGCWQRRYEVDGNPYWDAIVVAAFRKRPIVTLAWLLTDCAVNKLIDLQDTIEGKMNEAAGVTHEHG
jgi:hypothetical protein